MCHGTKIKGKGNSDKIKNHFKWTVIKLAFVYLEKNLTKWFLKK